MFDWLGRKQRLGTVGIADVLNEWRSVRLSGPTTIDTRRYIPGSIPSWTEWSGSPWVSARFQQLLAMEQQHLAISDDLWLHFSLPPGWEPRHPAEHRAAQKWGRWLSETEWQPPSGRVPTTWKEAVVRQPGGGVKRLLMKIGFGW